MSKIHTFHYSKVDGGVQRVEEKNLTEEQKATIVDRLFVAWNSASADAQAQLLSAIEEAKKSKKKVSVLTRPVEAEKEKEKKEAEKKAKKLAEAKEKEVQEKLAATVEAFDKLKVSAEVKDTIGKMIGREIRTVEVLEEWVTKLTETKDKKKDEK